MESDIVWVAGTGTNGCAQHASVPPEAVPEPRYSPHLMAHSMSEPSARPTEARVASNVKGLYPRVTQPLVDLLRRQFSDASRLLTAFLVAALLLAGMGLLSLVA